MGIEAAVIVDGPIRERSVGDGYLTLVGSDYPRMEDVYGVNPAEYPLGLDELTDLEGLERQKDKPTCEVLYSTAHRHTERHASGGEESGYRGGVYPESADHRKYEDRPQQHTDETLDERSQSGIRSPLLKALGYDLLDFPDQPCTDYVDSNGQDELQPELGNSREGPLQQFICRCVLYGINQLRSFREQ